MNAIERDLNVVRTLGWNGNAPATSLAFDRPQAKPRNLPRLIFGPSASRLAKKWPLQNYVQLAALLKDRAEIIFMAQSPEEFAALTPWGSLGHWIYTPQLTDAIALLQSADGYVGADSGIKHLAVALGLKTVTLFGPESVAEWHPYDQNHHRVLRHSVDCRNNDSANPDFAWCGAPVCPLASHACLTLIRPQTAAKEIERVFELPPSLE